MTLPNTFANETSPGMVELDQNFAAVANMATWNATATGTNVIALTTTANQPAVSAYTDRQRFQFVWPNNTTGSVTAGVNSLAQLPVYLPSGTQAGNGDGANGAPAEIMYLAALNSGAGGFQILSAVPASGIAAAGLGTFRGLLVKNNATTPNTKIDITALQASLVTNAGAQKFIAAPSVTIDLTTTGANGMDTGARPTNGWVYCYMISNGSVTAGVATITAPSAGNPAFPGGYSYYAYAGALWCNGSQNLMGTRQQGRRAQYVVGLAGTTTDVILDSGIKGSATVPTWVAASVSSAVPATAAVIHGALYQYNGGVTAQIAAAPNSNYGGIGSTTLMPFVSIIGNGNTVASGAPFSFVLESTSIYWGSNVSTAALLATGWDDYYVNA